MIQERNDQERGCGWRKPGGLYLVSSNLSRGCGKLPIELSVCPCCHSGIKPTRGFTWVSYDLIKNTPCNSINYEQFADISLPVQCGGCVPFDGSVQKFGLLWIGGKFYKTPKDFTSESARLGISRRIPAVPNDFVIGETWILLAHRECIKNPNHKEVVFSLDENDKETPFLPGIFQAFLPSAIEYIVKGTETPEEIESLEKRGLTCVQINKITTPELKMSAL